MELQHIVIRRHRLLLAAQAHEEKKADIYGIKSYDIHDLDSPYLPLLKRYMCGSNGKLFFPTIISIASRKP